MENNTILGFLGVLLLVSVFGTFFAWNAGNQEVAVSVDFNEVNARLDALGAGQVALGDKLTSLESQEIAGEDGEVVSVVPSGDYIRNQAEYEDDLSEAEALRLAEESVNLDDRDFLRALFDSLEIYDGGAIDIEDRDDILEIRYELDDVDLNNNGTAIVTFDKVRVYYFIDGDEDETEKAKLDNIVVTVNDLDFDDDFDDSEVSENYMDDLEVLKVYS